MVVALGEVDHVPAGGAQLAGAQPVAVGEQDHGGVAVGVAGAGRQDARRRRRGAGAAPRRVRRPCPLAQGRHPDPWRQPLCSARGHELLERNRGGYIFGGNRVGLGLRRRTAGRTGSRSASILRLSRPDWRSAAPIVEERKSELD